jgi:hypothetical protein
MNKRHLHHVWTKFRAIKPIYFLVIAIACGIVSVTALRANNQHMVQLRDAVYSADKSGEGVNTALDNLQNYVFAHMNTNLASGPEAVYPPIQLKYTYERLVSAEGTRVAAINSQVYTDAQHYCEQLYPGSFSGGPRVPCITSYVNSHGTSVHAIPDGLYKFSFVSPRWSPDLAGWSFVATVLSTLATIAVFAADRWFKRNL